MIFVYKDYEFKIDSELLSEAEAVLSKQGMTFEDALNIFANQVVAEKKIPFKLTEDDYDFIIVQR